MLGIIIGISVGIILFILFTKWDKEMETEEKTKRHHGMVWAFSILLGVLAFSLVDALACGIFRTAAVTTTDTTAKIASFNLVALQDNSSVTGQFFLGCGSVDNKSYYAFYYETPNGYKYETLNAKSSKHPVYIKYLTSNTESPHIDRYGVIRQEIYTAKVNPVWFSIFATLEYAGAKPGDVVSEETLTSPPLLSSGDIDYDDFRYEIIIPQGSIQQNYTIDLE